MTTGERPAEPSPAACPLFKWVDPPSPAPEAVDRLIERYGLLRPVAEVLVSRAPFDASDDAAADFFLKPTLDKLDDPNRLPGITEAVRIIWSAIREKRRIIVFGDFDADGVCATTILVKALRQLGATVIPFIPSRRDEGYGLTHPAIARCLRESAPEPPDLWLTVDCGITNGEEVRFLKNKGFTVIVTDHHEPTEDLPPADAVVDPRCGATPPSLRHLCGAGVGFYLVYALTQYGKKNEFYAGPGICNRILIETALATIADIVPLLGANRTLVHTALRRWKTHPNEVSVGLRTLWNRATQKTADPDADSFAFLFAPRINAAGRMDSAMVAHALLMTTDADEANGIALKLDGWNTNRKSHETKIFNEAVQLVSESPEAVVVGKPIDFTGESGWHPGVVGIVASRLMEHFRCPAAVVTFDGADPATATGRGSIRASAGYHVVDALHTLQDHFSAFGGHALAGGFTLKPGAYEAFKAGFTTICKQQRACLPEGLPRLTVNCWLASPDDITSQLYDAQQRLAPFGEANPKIRWGMRRVTIKQVKPVGNSGTHLAVVFAKAGKPLPRAVWFKHGGLCETLRETAEADIVFELVRSIFNGDETLDLHLIDIAPLKADSAL
ncbi:MAG: DHH family phosphoesterase [Kiritimatiellae bacterium]|nr:DHH family phosphoesterase [Kiritimatiellia bacterium]